MWLPLHYLIAVIGFGAFTAIAWLSGRLSWPLAGQWMTIFALCPIGVNWSWPPGQPHPSHWRGAVCLIVIAGLSVLVNRLIPS